uniref:Variant surface glycoprotein 1125.1094 n=1 Tax=Trypanosoma brucei TaxID=5691 RepID=A0A1J0R682_9TRYP|nr:variant surface glycoprotein 1125.1094 [Trypanosoma brucei]
MRQTRYIQEGTFLLALLPALVVSAGIPLHNRKAQINTPCDASHYAAAVGSNAMSAFTAAPGRAQEASIAASKLHLLASKLTGGQKAAATILAAAAGAKATETIGKIAATATNFVQGFAALKEIKGVQVVVAEMLKSKIEDVATVAAATSTSGGTIVKIKPKLQPATNRACHDSEVKPTKTQDKAAEEPGDVKLTLFSLKAETPGNTHNQKLPLCGHASHGQDPSTTACQDSRDNLGIKGGSFVVKEEITTTRTAAGGTISYSAVDSKQTVLNGDTITVQLSEIGKLETAVQNLEKITTTTEAKTLADQSDIKKALSRALAGHTASYADSKTKKQVEEFLAAVFGKDASTVTGVIVKELKDLKPPKPMFSGAEDTTLEGISDPNQIANAQIYYTVRSYMNDEEQKKKNQASPSFQTKTATAEEPKKTAEECKKHLTEKPCKDEKGCEFDDKKPDGERCFPKAEKDKKNEKSFSSNLRVSVSQAFIR